MRKLRTRTSDEQETLHFPRPSSQQTSPNGYESKAFAKFMVRAVSTSECFRRLNEPKNILS